MPAIKVSVVTVTSVARMWWTSKTPETQRRYQERVGYKRKYAWMSGCAALGLYATYLGWHLERDPVTGCRQLILIPDELLHMLSDDKNIEFIQDNWHYFLDQDHPTSKRVAGLVTRLLEANHATLARHYVWTVGVLDTPDLNAFALCNNVIVINRGMSDATDDNQLAGIIGHEMSHCSQRHLNQAMSVELACDLLHAMIAVAAFATLSLLAAAIAYVIVDRVMNFTIVMPHRRAQETEADQRGMFMAAAACFDPRPVQRFWQWMADGQPQGRQPWMSGILRTHPFHAQRSRDLAAALPAAVACRRSAGCDELGLEDDSVAGVTDAGRGHQSCSCRASATCCTRMDFR